MEDYDSPQNEAHSWLPNLCKFKLITYIYGDICSFIFCLREKKHHRFSIKDIQKVGLGPKI